MNNGDNVLNEILHLLDSQFFCVLATQAKDTPYCSLVAYAATDNCKEIIFATSRNSNKYRNLKENPNIALMVDSRKDRATDLSDARALTVLGAAGDIQGNSYEMYLGIYLEKNPDLKEFALNPDCALIKIEVSKYILVKNFQNIIEYNVKE